MKIENIKNIPKLRFPEFRNAPEWREKKLGEVSSFHKGKSISKSDIDLNGNIECIRYGELYTTYSEIINMIYSKTNLPLAELFLSCKNDVIIPASGETKIDIATASCILKDDVALGSDLNVIRTKENGIFLSYYLNSAKKYDIAKIAQGDTVVHLYATKLIALSISLPSFPEQQKIADCLSSLDDLITAQAEKVEALKAHKKGLMQKLFPAEGKNVPRLRFPEFRGCGEWDTSKLGKISKPIVKRAGTKKYTLLSVTAGLGLVSQLEKFGREIAGSAYKNYYVIKQGDFAYNKSSTKQFPEGYISMLIEYEEGAVPNSIFTCFNITDKEYFPKIFDHIFQSNFHGVWLRKFIAVGARSHGSLNIDDKYLWEMPITLPKLPEQQKIADCLSSLDDLITAQTKKIKVLKTHKKGLMQGLFVSVEEVEENNTISEQKMVKNYDQLFTKWIQNQGLVARGNTDMQTLRAIFDAMDEDDK